jgi:hypothetical protein
MTTWDPQGLECARTHFIGVTTQVLSLFLSLCVPKQAHGTSCLIKPPCLFFGFAEAQNGVCAGHYEIPRACHSSKSVCVLDTMKACTAPRRNKLDFTQSSITKVTKSEGRFFFCLQILEYFFFFFLI